jgi:IstB-like ATP binding protein
MMGAKRLWSDAANATSLRATLPGRTAARLRYARLRHQASVEDIDYRAARGLDRALFQKLAACGWIDAHENLILCGPTRAPDLARVIVEMQRADFTRALASLSSQERLLIGLQDATHCFLLSVVRDSCRAEWSSLPFARASQNNSPLHPVNPITTSMQGKPGGSLLGRIA